MSDAARARAARISTLPLLDDPRGRGPGSSTVGAVRDIWQHRELLGLLVRRELKARYKDSSLGVVWTLFRPIAQLAIYYFAIGQILGAARMIPSFAIFVFVGLTAWTLFTEILNNGTTSIVTNSGLVKKVYLPREIFPLASTGGALVNFAIQLAILLAATLVIGQFPLSWDVGYALLGFILVLLFATALGLLLSALNVYFRDIQHLVEVVLLVMFWVSPIVYSYQFVADFLGEGLVRELYLANPVTLGVIGMQRGLWTAGSMTDGVAWPPDLALRMAIALVASLVLLWISERVFTRLQGNFAQEL